MLESIILLIGNLVLPFLVLSLFAMLLVELVAQVWQLRAKTLKYSIRHMLDDGDGDSLADAVYRHPLIKSLSAGRKPDYIPGHLFALAFADEVKQRAGHDDFREAISRLHAKNFHDKDLHDMKLLRSGPLALLQHTHRGMELNVIERWFLEVMDQASGLYRRRTLLVLAGIAAAIILPLNFDAIRISNHITQRRLLEKVFEVRVDALAKRDPSPAGESALPGPAEVASLQALSFPIGWPGELHDQSLRGMMREGRFYDWALLKIVGLLTSILTIMLGAPLLFDMLNRYSIIRFTSKPRERVFGDPGPSDRFIEDEGPDE